MNKYLILKIKPGKRQKWIDWCNEIMQQKEEAILTLIEEDLVRERCIIFQDFVFCEYETVEGKDKKPMNSDKEINKKHFKIFHECLEKVVGEPAVVGYDIKVNQ